MTRPAFEASPARWARGIVRTAGAIGVALAVAASPASAAPITSHVVGCVGDVCTAAPDGGPVAVDPLGFTLEAFSIYGFLLALSDGSGVDTMDWVPASFRPASAPVVPEPETLALMGIGATVLVLRRVMRLRAKGPGSTRAR